MRTFSELIRGNRSAAAAAALAGLALAILLSSCRSVEQAAAARMDVLSTVVSTRSIRVAYIQYPPFVYRDAETGKMAGLFVDILEAITTQIAPDFRVNYEETTWADFGASLTSGRVDLSIAGTFATIARARVVTFTRPLVYLGRSAVVRRDDGRFSASLDPTQFDQSGIRVAVVTGEGSHEFVRTFFKGRASILEFSGSELSQSLAAVSAGQADVGLSDALETFKYQRAHPEVVDLYAQDPYDVTPIAWAVRQDDLIWLNFLNTALELLDSQGRIEALAKKYDGPWSVKPPRHSSSARE